MEVPLSRIRNIGIMAHIDAGKTTTTERILYCTGKTHRVGDVNAGDSQMDWMELERERGITITAASTTCFWREHQISIIDTPGHVDFVVEVERSLRVLDGAIGIFCAVSGVEAQSEAVWRQANRHGIPRLAFINKMDRRGADFYRVLEEMHSRLGANAVPVQIPLGSEEAFEGVIDLLEMRSLVWSGERDGMEVHPLDGLSDEVLRQAEYFREHLLERLAERSDEVLEDIVENRSPSVDRLRQVLRQATLDGAIFPVFCGAAYRNLGIQPLLDGVCQYLPSPEDLPRVRGIVPDTGEYVDRGVNDSFSALAFKVMSDPYAGKLVYFRIYSGEIKSGATVLNASVGQRDRVMRLLRMHANKREELRRAGAGDIVAATGLKRTGTGDTLCEISDPVILESMVFPEPVVAVAIEPKTQGDADRLLGALRALEDEDPTFRVESNPDTGQTVMSGMGELHIEILVERLAREYQVQASVGQPQVAYRETITRSATADGRFDRPDMGTGRAQYGHVVMRFEPLPAGAGFLFENEAPAVEVPLDFVSAVQRGVEESRQAGVLAGYPMVDFRCILEGGSHRETDSSEMAFRVAASMAYKTGMEAAGARLLEPLMELEVFLPEEHLGSLIGDISGRAGSVESVDDVFEGKVVRAGVPLREMFGYAAALRSATGGRATFTMQFREYRKVPPGVQEDLLKQYR